MRLRRKHLRCWFLGCCSVSLIEGTWRPDCGASWEVWELWLLVREGSAWGLVMGLDIRYVFSSLLYTCSTVLMYVNADVESWVPSVLAMVKRAVFFSPPYANSMPSTTPIGSFRTVFGRSWSPIQW